MSTQLKAKKKILIVDDEPDIGQLIAEILEPYFESITIFDNSEKALESILANHYDLILTDIMMPKLSGEQLIRFSRSHGVLCPIVFITGQADKDVLLSGLRLGAADIIEKPFDSQVLISSAQRVIEIEKRREQYILNKHNPDLSEDVLKKKRKMIGLFIVSSEQKKIG